MGLCASREQDADGTAVLSTAPATGAASAAKHNTKNNNNNALSVRATSARQQSHQQQQSHNQPPLPLPLLPDEVLAPVLAALPLPALLQLACSSARVRALVDSGAALTCADLEALPSSSSAAAALRWLTEHAHAAGALREASLPVNDPGTPALLRRIIDTSTTNNSNSSALVTLRLYIARPHYSTRAAAAAAAAAAPPLTALPLADLTSLTTLELALEPGAVGRSSSGDDSFIALALPPTLERLTLRSGNSFAATLAALDPAALPRLRELRVRASDSGGGGLAAAGGAAAKALSVLSALPALRVLALGRLWAVPRDLGALFDRLEHAELELVSGRVLRGVFGGVEHPLSAAASGVVDAAGLAASRPRVRLALALDVPVTGLCGGLAPDWASLGAALRRLSVEGAAPACGAERDAAWARAAVFDVAALASLPRLASLRLSFDPPEAPPGAAVTLHLPGLPLLPGLSELALRVKGANVTLHLEAPPRLRTLLVAADGGVTLAPPGEDAGADSAALVEASLSSSSTSSSSANNNNVSAPPPVVLALRPGGGLGRCSFGGNGSSELPRMLSIEEGETIWEQEDAAQQLSRISTLGVLAARLRVADPSATAALASAAASGARRGGRRGADSAPAADGSLPLAAWLGAKGLDLAALDLEQCYVAGTVVGAGAGAGGRAGGGAGAARTLVARRGMAAGVLDALRAWGAL